MGFVGLCIAGFVIIFLFLLPVKTGRIWNIGNQTGVFLGIVLLIAVGILRFHPGLFFTLWENKTGKILFGTAGIICCGILILAVAETACMVKAAVKKPEPGAPLVVLGCKILGERASLTLVSRLEAAFGYLKRYPDALCILSGGQGADEPISEAECMYRYLRKKGIESSRLIKEDRSTSTRENLLYSMALLPAAGEIAIATSEFHQYRASCIAKELGLKYGAVSGCTPWWLLPTFYVRELYGILYEWLCSR